MGTARLNRISKGGRISLGGALIIEQINTKIQPKHSIFSRNIVVNTDRDKLTVISYYSYSYVALRAL